jgi:hypothetical protein
MKKLLFAYPLHTLTFTALLVIHGLASIALLTLFSSGWTFLFLMLVANIYFLITVGGAIFATIILLAKKKFFVKAPVSLMVLLLGIQLLALFSLPADCGDCGQTWSGPLSILSLPLVIGFIIIHGITIWMTLKDAASSSGVDSQAAKRSFLGTIGICTWLGSYWVSAMALYSGAVTGKLSIPTIPASWNFMPGLATLNTYGDSAFLVSSLLLSVVVALVPAIVVALLIHIWWQTTKNPQRFRWLVFGILVIMLVAMQLSLLPRFSNVTAEEHFQQHISCTSTATNFHDFKTCLTEYRDFAARWDGEPEKRVDKIISNCEQFPTTAPNFTEDGDTNIARCSGYTQRDLCKLLVAEKLFETTDYENYIEGEDFDFEAAEIKTNQLLFAAHLKICRHLGDTQAGTCQITKQDYCLYSLSKSIYVSSSDLPNDDNHCSYISDAQLKHQCLTERCQSLYLHSPDQAKTCIQQLTEI